MSPEPPWITDGPAAFWHAAWAEACKTNPRWRDGAGDEDFWQGAAADYDERSPLAACATELIADLRALLPVGGHLLEIGSGTGAFSRRLAPGLARITCVEPSAAMRRAFNDAWDQTVATKTLPVDWSDAPSDLVADVVLCANALYRTSDIEAALAKMTATASHHVAIVQSVGRPHTAPLVVHSNGHVWERERADALCDVLDGMGLSWGRRDYRVARPSAESRVALIVWDDECRSGSRR